MNKRWYFQSRKELVTHWLGMAGYVANALFRTLGLNSFDDDTSSSSCPWDAEVVAKTLRRLSYPSAFPLADEDTDEGRSEAKIEHLEFVVDHIQWPECQAV